MLCSRSASLLDLAGVQSGARAGFGGLKISLRKCFFLLSNYFPPFQPAKAKLSKYQPSLFISAESRVIANESSASVYLFEITKFSSFPTTVFQLREESVAFLIQAVGFQKK
jgi:hypothetical protein